jgi:hypothetical protein
VVGREEAESRKLKAKRNRIWPRRVDVACIGRSGLRSYKKTQDRDAESLQPTSVLRDFYANVRDRDLSRRGGRAEQAPPLQIWMVGGLEPLPDFGGVVIPRPILADSGGGFTDTSTKRCVCVEVAQNCCQD